MWNTYFFEIKLNYEVLYFLQNISFMATYLVVLLQFKITEQRGLRENQSQSNMDYGVWCIFFGCQKVCAPLFAFAANSFNDEYYLDISTTVGIYDNGIEIIIIAV